MGNRIAIIGPGAVGLTYACELAPSHEVVLCGRRPVGTVTFDRPPEPARPVELTTVTAPEQLGAPAWDWVLVAVKAHQVAGAADWLGALARPGTRIAVLQNGVEQRESVAPHLDGQEVLPTIVWSGSELVSPGHLKIIGDLRLVVPDDDLGRDFAALFARTAVAVETAPDFDLQAWRKLLANAVAGLEVLALRRASMFHLDDVYDLAYRLARECAEVARATGVDLGEADVRGTADLYRAIAPDIGTSMLYDRIADRPLEWDVRNGVICRLGRRHGVPTPVSDVIVPLLRAASGEQA